MDIITHGLFAYSIANSIRKTKQIFLYFLLLGAVIPDIGEIVIQKKLSEKFGETIAVYDERTSDFEVASAIEVTFLYDILHSLVLPTILLLVSILIKNIKLKSILRFLSIGLISHIFLDSFTHGKIWALKLIFPISNNRFLILSESIGNWWDWTPKLGLFYFKLPIYCLLIWTTLIIYNLIMRKRKEKPNAQQRF